MVGRGHSIAQGHAPKVDRGGALVLLAIQADRDALQALAPRGGSERWARPRPGRAGGSAGAARERAGPAVCGSR
jgi:hypothetical protein